MPGKIIVGIPGLWSTNLDVIVAVAQANEDIQNPRYLAAGPVIMDMQSKEGFGFDVYDHDPRLQHAFEVAGQGRLSSELLSRISNHTRTVYLVSRQQDVEAARSMLRLATHLLDAGGLAVKVETSGVAHSAERWRYFAAMNGLLSLHDAYVTLVGSNEFNYTCGMHNLALPDVSLTADIPKEAAPEYLVAFNQWNLLERPELSDGAKFATSLSDPVFEMKHREYGYNLELEYNNPFGRWHLTVANDTAEKSELITKRTEPLFMAFKSDDPEMIECVRKAQASGALVP